MQRRRFLSLGACALPASLLTSSLLPVQAHASPRAASTHDAADGWRTFELTTQVDLPAAAGSGPARVWLPVATSPGGGYQQALGTRWEAPGAKAKKSGFDWPDWHHLLPKIAEETAELQAEVESHEPGQEARVDAELGDLLFTVVNLGRHLRVDAEMALRGCNRRFRERFREMEMASDRPLEERTPEELEALWSAAKKKLAERAGTDQQRGRDAQ